MPLSARHDADNTHRVIVVAPLLCISTSSCSSYGGDQRRFFLYRYRMGRVNCGDMSQKHFFPLFSLQQSSPGQSCTNKKPKLSFYRCMYHHIPQTPATREVFYIFIYIFIEQDPKCGFSMITSICKVYHTSYIRVNLARVLYIIIGRLDYGDSAIQRLLRNILRERRADISSVSVSQEERRYEWEV